MCASRSDEPDYLAAPVGGGWSGGRRANSDRPENESDMHSTEQPYVRACFIAQCSRALRPQVLRPPRPSPLSTTAHETGTMTRPPIIAGMLANWLDDVKAALLEFVGTTTFLLLAFGGVQAASSEMDSTSGAGTNNVIHVMYIALAMGFSLLISVWIFYRASGGVFNPNVSLALFLTGVVGPLRFVLYCIAQLIGGIVAAALVLALTPGRLQSVYVLCSHRIAV